MRQIYNTESPPEMLMDLPQTPTNEYCNPPMIQSTIHLSIKNDEVQQLIAASNTITGSNIGSKNPSRLSLANLLPSRLEP